MIEEAAHAVLEVTGIPDGKALFLSSGSEAVEFGVQVVRRLTDRPLLLTLTDAYLAAYGSAGEKRPDAWHSFDWRACTNCPHAEACDPDCERLRTIPFEHIGGFAFEPGNTGGLVRFPPGGLVRTLAQRIQAEGGLLIVDEVTTGMGRTGAWFGFEHYGLAPDLVALGKGLGSGYPVSAVAMQVEIAERLTAGDFHYAQSHQNDPLPCAVAKEVITVIANGDLVARSARVGDAFRQALASLAARRPTIKEVRGRGLMIAVEFEAAPNGPPVLSLYHQLLAQGFIVGCKPAAQVLRFYPPLIINETDIIRLLEALAYLPTLR